MEIATVVMLTVGIMLLIFGVVLLLVVRSIRGRFDGYLDVSARKANMIHQLDILIDPNDLRKQKYVVFKVRKVPDL